MKPTRIFTHVGFAGLLLSTPVNQSYAANAMGNAMPTVTDTNPGADTMDWSAEDRYWRERYPTRPYYEDGSDYEAYQPAYRYGADMYNRYQGRPFDELDDAELRTNWESRSNPSLSWDRAREAARDSYTRMYERNRDIGTQGITGTNSRVGTGTIGSGNTSGSGATTGSGMGSGTSGGSGAVR